MRKILKNISALIVGVVLSMLLLEGFLKIYNPLQTRIKDNKIILPANKVYKFDIGSPKKLDKELFHTRNSIGLRGPEKPENFGNFLSIITIGGSTTECFYLSDNKTWSHILGQKLKLNFDNVWLNNAGLGGHSTFGHLIMFQDHIIKLKPKIVLFYIGLNDVGREDLEQDAKKSLNDDIGSFREFLFKKSEIANLCINLVRTLNARKRNLIPGLNLETDFTKFDILDLADEYIEKVKFTHRKYLDSYKERVLKLVELSKTNGIIPILITQAVFWGKGVDPLTNINLETIKLGENNNSRLQWELLELYNDVTREVGKITNTLVIDVANKLPKSSLYFYDYCHNTNQGAEKVAEIINDELTNYLKTKYTKNYF